MFTAAFLLSLHENMWCQAVSDPTPYAVTLGGACYPNDTFIPTWSHVLPGSLLIPKPNMPAHTQQTERMIPVLYEVLTTHMGVAPRGTGGGPGTPSILPSESQLAPGQHISSPDGRYRLVFQTDGNLVIYRADGAPVWSIGDVQHLAQRRQDADGRQLRRLRHREHSALAYPHVREPRRLPVDAEQRRLRDQQRQRRAALGKPRCSQRSGYAAAAAARRTPSPDTLAAGARIYPGQAVQSLDRRFALTYQTDGNLVLYGPGGVPRWSTQAFSSPGYVEMQVDGNFVVYASNGTPVWASGTSGARDARLVVHNDGEVNIRTSQGIVVWQTGTGGS